MLKRTFAVILSMLLLFVFLAGCTADELAYIDVLQKYAKITSGETTQTFSIDFYEVPDYTDHTSKAIQGLLSELNFSSESAFITDQENGLLSMSSEFGVTADDISLFFNMWMKADDDGLTAVVKLPTYIRPFLPDDLQGKEYVYIDATAEADGVDVQAVLKKADEVNAAMFDFIKSYAGVLNTSKVYVTKKGLSFEIKIDDAALKALIREIVLDYCENEKSRALVRELVISYYDLMLAGEPTVGDYLNKTDISKQLDEAERWMVDNVEVIKTYLDAMDGVRLLGTKGITATVTVDSDGYIVSSDGVYDINIDVGALARLIDPKDTTEGSLGILITQQTKNEKTNQRKEVTLPVLTDDNSFSFNDLMESNYGGDYEYTPPPEPEYTPLEPGEIWIELGYWSEDRMLFEHKPVQIGGVTYVHLGEFVEEVIGISDVTQAPDTGIVSFVSYNYMHGYIDYSLTPGSNTISFSYDTGEGEYRMKEPTRVIDGSVYVPLRSFCGIIDITVFWDPDTGRIYVY